MRSRNACRPLHVQLSDARESRGLTLRELKIACGLPITTQSLARKLRGTQSMTLEEAGVIARMLGVNFLQVPPT